MTATYKTPDEAQATGLKDVRSRFTGADISKASTFYHLVALMRDARMGASGYAKGRYNATRPDLATGTDLDDLAGVFGLTRKAATTAIQLEAEVEVTTAAGAWGAAMALTSTSGLAFETAWAGAWTTATTQTLTINSTSTGTECNLPVGAELTISSPPAGMDSTATISSTATTEATNEETDSELQRRLRDYIGGAVTSSNEAAFQSMVLSRGCDDELNDNDYPPMLECYVYPSIRGIRTVEAVPLKKWTGTTKIPAAAAMTHVENYIDTVAPAYLDFDAVQVTSQGVDVRVTLTTDDGYGRDWGTASDTSINTDGAVHTSTKLMLDADPAGATYDIKTGDRILVCVGSNYYPNVRTVAGISSADNSLTVTEPLTDENGAEVSNGQLGPNRAVRPAGPISQACVDAVLAMFADMTPSDTAGSVRFPPVSQTYPEDITEAMIYRRLLDASDHILDVTITTGTTTATTASLSGGVLVAYLLEPDGDNDWLRIEFSSLND